jgi:hypothetical protein
MDSVGFLTVGGISAVTVTLLMAVGPTQPPAQWIVGVKNSWSVEQTMLLYLVSRLKFHGTLPLNSLEMGDCSCGFSGILVS